RRAGLTAGAISCRTHSHRRGGRAKCSVHWPAVAEIEAEPKNPERLEVEELTALQPGLARLMPEIGARFWKAHYAAHARNWPLASWQLREMRKLMRLCIVTRPKYSADLEEFIHDDVEPLLDAL